MNPLDIVNPPAETALLPDPEVPYFVPTARGWFVHKLTTFGKVFVPTNVPTHLPTLTKAFTPTLKVPGRLVGQAHSFFRVVFASWGTESAVLITRNHTTGEWRLFIPEQYVSRGGVQQRFNPEHIAPGWDVVGSIHSHCNFGAFHSGTDTHDADDFDGFHMTIGHVDRDTPEYATMFAFNKQHFEVRFEDGVDVADIGTDRDRTAPAWWLRYVHANETAPWLKNRGVTVVRGGRQPGVTYVNGQPVGSGYTGPSVHPERDPDYARWWASGNKPVEDEETREARRIREETQKAVALLAAVDLEDLAEFCADNGLKLYWSITPEGRGAALASSYMQAQQQRLLPE